MDEQLSFFDSGGAEPKDSLYFALRPETALQGEMARYREDLCARHGLKPKLVPVERFHLTLLDVGSFDGLPARYVEGALRAGEAAAGLAEPFEFELNQSLTYSGRFLVLIPEGSVPLLKALREELLRQMTKQGLKVASGSGLSSHVTLAYIKQHLAKEAMGPLGWPVKEIALIHSIKNQPEVIELGSWRL